MISTTKISCAQVAELLYAHGVEKAVLCPGSRNLPLINAFSLHDAIECVSIVDERCAAFYALGVAEITGRPVAIVCTSGTALLNFAPAIAEAYYKKFPLIAVTADRPQAWIDQNDSQTLRQSGALEKIVKGTFVLPLEENDEELWHANRLINEAMITALSECRGPVHINVPLSKPLNRLREYTHEETCRLFRKITLASCEKVIEKDFMRHAAERVQATSKVMIVAGGMPPSNKISRKLAKIAAMNNVALLCENLSNLHCRDAVLFCDEFLTVGEMDEAFVPELLITFGDSLVSNRLKAWIRKHSANIEHWHVGTNENIVDTFFCQTTKFKIEPESFFLQLSQHMRLSAKSIDSNYRLKMLELRDRVYDINENKLRNDKWGDGSVLYRLVARLPLDVNMQVSNGLAVRLLMRIPRTLKFHRVDCNRGVSGIDGCTSTAIGACPSANHTTVLVSGDMSALYDLGAFAMASRLTRNFKMIILANGGGQIFNQIEKNEDKEIANDFLVAADAAKVDFAEVAAACNWRVFEASNFDELADCYDNWIAQRCEPSLLIVNTFEI